MSLQASLDAAVSDGRVEFTFEVRNDGDDPVEVTFPDGKTADVAVNEGDDEVWRWSAGRMFTQMIQRRTVDPGDRLVETRVWESPSPGDYEAVATLAARNVDVEARTSFSV